MGGNRISIAGFSVIAALVAAVAAGCGTTSTPLPSPTPIVVLSAIVITPSSPDNLAVGSVQQFTAIGSFSDNSSADVSSEVTWASSDASVALVSASGLATGVAPGTAGITASFAELVSPAVTLTVVPGPELTLPPQYYSPLSNARYVSKSDTIIVRYGPLLTEEDIDRLDFTVRGSESGQHGGQKILADDHRTVIFKPDSPFMPGEEVEIDVNSLYLDSGASFEPLSYAFTVSVGQTSGTPGSASVPDSIPQSAFPDFLTVPQDIPHYTVEGALSGEEQQYVFVAPFYWTKSTVGSYLLILDKQGRLVYWKSVADGLAGWDFKVQPNGLLSYFDQKASTFYLMDSSYRVVDSYQAGNGYVADLHDYQLLPDGDALLMIYDTQTVDMSAIVDGGQKDAAVTGLVIQRIDLSKDVVFQWRSWDHFSFGDSPEDLTVENIDLVHGNSLALADDGNLLLSSRNLSEVTKIDLQTGDVMWRLGGKANQFAINGRTFAYQHDAAQLPNGNVTVFDNQGAPGNPAPSAGIEYKVDETEKTATVVWEYEHDPPVFAMFMGNMQRLPDGNNFIGWGAPSTEAGYEYVSMTEATSDGRALFDLSFDQPYVSYRAFVFPWNGSPETEPDLAAVVDAGGITLGYSWNGSTAVASYQVFGGASPETLALIETEAKVDFETQSHFAGLSEGRYYYQIAAIDGDGREMARSRIIEVDLVG